MRLAVTDLFRARWTAAIHDEWTRNALKNRPDLTLEDLARTRALMDMHVRDCIVVGYESLIDSLTLPDENDRHVLAAATCAGAGLIVNKGRDRGLGSRAPGRGALPHEGAPLTEALNPS